MPNEARKTLTVIVPAYNMGWCLFKRLDFAIKISF